MNPSRPHNSGFTMTELLIVVAIAGILAAIAMPSFTSLVQSQRVKSASFDFYSILSVARSEAIKRNADIAVAPVFVGGNLDRINVSAGGTLLHSRSVSSSVVINTAVTGITFRRNGRIDASGTPTFQIDIKGATTSTPSPHARCITISLSGVPNVRKGAC